MWRRAAPLPVYRRARPEPGHPAQGAAAPHDQYNLLKYRESEPTRCPNQRRLVSRLGVNAHALRIHHLPFLRHEGHMAGEPEA